MDASTWKPYGLITYPGLETKYLMAKQSVDDRGNLLVDPRQYKAVNLFEYLFNKFVFKDLKFSVSSQTPNIQSHRACDIVIECETPNGAWKILCFAGAKRDPNNSQPLVIAVEEQALGYCKDFLTANSDIGKDEDLMGFWDGQFRESYRYYLDIGDDANVARLNHAFDSMKSIPTSQLGYSMNHENMKSIATSRLQRIFGTCTF